jgi:hypothetical protein
LSLFLAGDNGPSFHAEEKYLIHFWCCLGTHLAHMWYVVHNMVSIAMANTKF